MINYWSVPFSFNLINQCHVINVGNFLSCPRNSQKLFRYCKESLKYSHFGDKNKQMLSILACKVTLICQWLLKNEWIKSANGPDRCSSERQTKSRWICWFRISDRLTVAGIKCDIFCKSQFSVLRKIHQPLWCPHIKRLSYSTVLHQSESGKLKGKVGEHNKNM